MSKEQKKEKGGLEPLPQWFLELEIPQDDTVFPKLFRRVLANHKLFEESRPWLVSWLKHYKGGEVGPDIRGALMAFLGAAWDAKTRYLFTPDAERLTLCYYTLLLIRHPHYPFGLLQGDGAVLCELVYTLENPQSWQSLAINTANSEGYERVPWDGELIQKEDHILFISGQEPGMVSYFQTPEKGERGIRTRTRAGRYLSKFYPDLPSDKLEAYVAKAQNAASVLKFAADQETIERLYTASGMSSCMSYSKSHFNTPVHPSAVYAESDLQVAYIEEDGKPIARAVVWPEKKLYYQVYGDGRRLKNLLEEAGFTFGYLDGARVRALYTNANKDTLIFPYIDGVDRASLSGCGKWVVLDDDGPVSCNSTYGKVSVAGKCCECCGDAYDEDAEWHYVRTAHGEEEWCEGCWENNTFHCDRTGEYHSDNDFTAIEVDILDSYGHRRTQWWCHERTEDDFFTSDLSGDNFSEEDFEAITLGNGDVWADCEVAERAYECAVSNELWPEEEISEAADTGNWVSHEHAYKYEGEYYETEEGLREAHPDYDGSEAEAA